MNSKENWLRLIKIGQLKRIMGNIQPDIVHFHDDWGNKTNLFLPPETARIYHDELQKYGKDYHQRLQLTKRT